MASISKLSYWEEFNRLFIELWMRFLKDNKKWSRTLELVSGGRGEHLLEPRESYMESLMVSAVAFGGGTHREAP